MARSCSRTPASSTRAPDLPGIAGWRHAGIGMPPERIATATGPVVIGRAFVRNPLLARIPDRTAPWPAQSKPATGEPLRPRRPEAAAPRARSAGTTPRFPPDPHRARRRTPPATGPWHAAVRTGTGASVALPGRGGRPPRQRSQHRARTERLGRRRRGPPPPDRLALVTHPGRGAPGGRLHPRPRHRPGHRPRGGGPGSRVIAPVRMPRDMTLGPELEGRVEAVAGAGGVANGCGDPHGLGVPEGCPIRAFTGGNRHRHPRPATGRPFRWSSRRTAGRVREGERRSQASRNGPMLQSSPSPIPGRRHSAYPRRPSAGPRADHVPHRAPRRTPARGRASPEPTGQREERPGIVVAGGVAAA